MRHLKFSKPKALLAGFRRMSGSGGLMASFLIFLAIPLKADTAASEYHLDVETAELAPLAILDTEARDDSFANRVCKGVEENYSKVQDLEIRLTNANWNYSGKMTPDQFNETSRVSVQTAEDNVYKLTQIARDELRSVFHRAKSEILEVLVKSQKYHPSLSPSEQSELEAKLQNVSFVYGREYVNSVVEELKLQHPKVSDNLLMAKGYSLYHKRCGRNGLAKNAFLSSALGAEGRHEIVLCPGLVVFLSDFETNKPEILNAMHFIFGQEFGHFVAERMPKAHDRMSECYADEIGLNMSANPKVKAQVVADFWGAQVISERLAEVDPAERRKSAYLAMQPICDEAEGSEAERTNGFRIGQIVGRHPGLAPQMGREGPSKKRPYCSITGRIPSV